MVRVSPERRTPVDLVVTAIIVVLLAVGATVVWYHSAVRATTSTVATTAPADVAEASAVPLHLVPRWQAQSPATATPAIAESTVLTGSQGSVVGHDPVTGRQLWSYHRNLSLCAAIAAWPRSSDLALAVYRNSRGCSEVTALDAKTGARRSARTSDADTVLNLTSDAAYALAQGPARLETWGSNLVRGIEYGRVQAPVRTDAQPVRTGCRFFSSSVSDDRIAVIEHCGSEPGYRLTVLGAVLDKDEKVTQYGSSIITSGTAGPAPVLVTMSSSAIAVYDGGVNWPEPRQPSIRVFTADGAEDADFTVKGPTAPPATSVAIRTPQVTTYWTGSSTLVFDPRSSRPRFEVPDTLGPGDVMADQLLLPSRTGISVRDISTLHEITTIPLHRSGSANGPISLRVIGSMVIEQRGTTIEAYGPQ